MQKSSAPATVADVAALLARYEQRAAVVAVIGLGYVGLPLVKAILGAGFKVVGLDVDQAKVTALEQGRTYIRHLPAEPFSAAIAGGRFLATTDFAALKDADAI